MYKIFPNVRTVLYSTEHFRLKTLWNYWRNKRSLRGRFSYDIRLNFKWNQCIGHTPMGQTRCNIGRRVTTSYELTRVITLMNYGRIFTKAILCPQSETTEAIFICRTGGWIVHATRNEKTRGGIRDSDSLVCDWSTREYYNDGLTSNVIERRYGMVSMSLDDGVVLLLRVRAYFNTHHQVMLPGTT